MNTKTIDLLDLIADENAPTVETTPPAITVATVPHLDHAPVVPTDEEWDPDAVYGVDA